MSRPTAVSIDLGALRANLDTVKQLAPSSKTLAVVKANAYGHGAVEVAKALQGHCDKLTVSCIEEAQQLRQAGIKQTIVLLEGAFEAHELAWASANQCDVVVHNEMQLQQLFEANLAAPMAVWLKIDTGMHRLGIAPEQVTPAVSALQQSSKVTELVLMSHFSCADELSSEFTQQQSGIFDRCHAQLDSTFSSSLANSAAILAWPDCHRDWVRPGIMLYGISPFSAAHPIADRLQPVMNFSTQIIALRQLQAGESVGYGNTWTAQRPSVIATLAAGYGDGYPRHAKNGTPVVIEGQRAPLVGRVSMDLISVDVTDIAHAQLGSTACLWGKSLSVNEVAAWADTIGYELVTRMPQRVKPSYVN